MAFRFVRSAGSVHEPATVNVYASGTIQRNSVVEFNTGGYVTPASSSTTCTNVFGVSLDYAEGASDTQVRVIPFVPGQLWEADLVNAIDTAQIFNRHQLKNNLLINNTSYDHSGAQGIFLIYSVVGSSSGSGKVIGEFLRVPKLGQNSSLFF